VIAPTMIRERPRTRPLQARRAAPSPHIVDLAEELDISQVQGLGYALEYIPYGYDSMPLERMAAKLAHR
jgi:hypothetical protein